MASDKYSLKTGLVTDYSEEILKIREILKGLIKESRYEHSLGVSYISAALAMRYGADLRKAEIAGLVHDCAKGYKDSELIEKCLKHGITLSEDIIKSPQVIHACYGAYFAQKQFGIEDPEILHAVYYHTVGRPDMTLLEKIVFTADYIEPRRSKADRLPEIRRLAFTDLDRAVYEILHDTVEYLESREAFICRESLETLEYYKNKLSDEQSA